MPGVAGKSGQHKTPTGVLLKRGAWRGKQRAKTEMEARPELFSSPEDMSEAKRMFYEKYVPSMKASGTISGTDSIAFEMLATAYVKWKAINDLMKKDSNDIARMFFPRMVDGRIEGMDISGLAKMELEHFRCLQSMLIQFGFTPATRANVTRIDIKTVKPIKIT